MNMVSPFNGEDWCNTCNIICVKYEPTHISNVMTHWCYKNKLIHGRNLLTHPKAKCNKSIFQTRLHILRPSKILSLALVCLLNLVTGAPYVILGVDVKDFCVPWICTQPFPWLEMGLVSAQTKLNRVIMA